MENVFNGLGILRQHFDFLWKTIRPGDGPLGYRRPFLGLLVSRECNHLARSAVFISNSTVVTGELE
jgi:hypothetical protein